MDYILMEKTYRKSKSKMDFAGSVTQSKKKHLARNKKLKNQYLQIWKVIASKFQKYNVCFSN
jgi:hypothetical protein